MKTIYETKGAALEYCKWAVDIYENCPHKCSYCYAKDKAEKHNKSFEFNGVRNNVIEETKLYLENHLELKGEMIFLGFSSDPFPVDKDISATIEMAKLLKEFGCKVMICTKGRLTKDVKTALEYIDSVGITLTCGKEMSEKYEGNAASIFDRMDIIKYAKSLGKETWVSFEPVLEEKFIYDTLNSDFMNYVDTAKLDKLNHMNISDLTGNEADNIDWANYAKNVIDICKKRNINYMVKWALKQFI